jgi:hypothetical protein
MSLSADPSKTQSQSKPLPRGSAILWSRVLSQLHRLTPIFLAACLIMGAILRLVALDDMEYKADEKYMFDRALLAGGSEPYPRVGMPSGVGTPNPGLSVWAFIGLARLLELKSPVALARAVALLSIAALTLLLFRSLELKKGNPVSSKTKCSDARGLWTWSFAFACVNPFSVLYSRKIWAQSILPIFCLLFWWGWSKRAQRLGAWAWGLMGGLLGQVHMSGFFLAGAALAWILIAEGVHASIQKTNWRYWFLGCFMSVIPLIPWLQDVVLPRLSPGYVSPLFGQTRFYDWRSRLSVLKLFFKDGLGLDLRISLSSESFEALLNSHLMVRLAHEFLRAILPALIIFTLFKFWRALQARSSKHSLVPKSQPRKIFGGFLATSRRWLENPLGLGFATVILGYLPILSASGVPLFQHYFIILFPWTTLGLVAWVFFVFPPGAVPGDTAQGPRGHLFQTTNDPLGQNRHWKRNGLLFAIWLSQVIISASFLHHVHLHGGDPKGDYGTSYRLQLLR